MKFEDIDVDWGSGNCFICETGLPDGSPWAVCFDMEWDDKHADNYYEAKTMMCQDCAERLLKHGLGRLKEDVIPDPPVYDGLYYEALEHLSKM